MTITRNTLGQLYMQGIIDHTPLGICDTFVGGPSDCYNPYSNIKSQVLYNSTPYAYRQFAGYRNIGGPTYLDAAMSGELYRNNNYDDNFISNRIHPNMQSDEYGSAMDMELMMYGEEGKEVRKSLIESGRKAKEKFSNAHPMVKGFSALGLVAFALTALLKGKKGIFKKR
ncbi:hypothetical protein IJO12_02205 [bacterium]|nr:hypothetical protein [bacterium]